MLQERHQPTREEQAADEIRRTRMTPALARVTAGLFLAVIGAVPLIQHLDELNRYRLGFSDRAWPAGRGLGERLRSAARVYQSTTGAMPRRVLAANRLLLPELDSFAREIEEASWMTRLALPPTQWVMTRWFLTGNEKVYPGRGGWLFYRPDVDFAAGTPFLDLKGRPDPVACVADFSRQLNARGIRLIVLPVPPKAAMYPGLFTGAAKQAPIGNPAFLEFVRRLRKAGVAVLDGSPVLEAGRRQAGHPLYLAADTHWRPEGMELVARELADLVSGTGLLAKLAPSGYRRQLCNVTSYGDTATLIKTPASCELAAPETVRLSQILRPDGLRWTKARDAEVLVLGDSFANIYSLPSLGWGASAGLVEQVAFFLQRPLDSITFNDHGASATRQELARQIKHNPDRLRGKKCLVWEFAARELAFGDWTCIPLE